MRDIKPERARSTGRPANPYLEKGRHPELERIIEEGKKRRLEGQASPVGGQEDSGGEGEDDGLRGGWGRIPAFNKKTPQPSAGVQMLKAMCAPASKSSQPVPSRGATVAVAAGDDDDDSPPSGIYDGLAKLDADIIVDKNYLAKMFGVSEKTIRRRVAAGELPPPHTRMRRQPQWFAGLLLEWVKGEARCRVEEAAAHRRHILGKSE